MPDPCCGAVRTRAGPYRLRAGSGRTARLPMDVLPRDGTPGGRIATVPAYERPPDRRTAGPPGRRGRAHRISDIAYARKNPATSTTSAMMAISGPFAQPRVRS
ncbi:hypothetical protein SY2F82_13800 [Streptomyces sp. Y2F8-2]|nr:hypothetical protein SY2F82_13800 [Streptomyces sp. Y2F8-2]